MPKLPNADRAVVDLGKLRDYSLNPLHEVGKHKARVPSAGPRAHDRRRRMAARNHPAGGARRGSVGRAGLALRPQVCG